MAGGMLETHDVAQVAYIAAAVGRQPATVPAGVALFKAPRVMSSRVSVISSVPALLILALFYACGGSSRFNVAQPATSKCDIAVGNSMARVPAAGGKGNLTVETNRECSWSARAE